MGQIVSGELFEALRGLVIADFVSELVKYFKVGGGFQIVFGVGW